MDDGELTQNVCRFKTGVASGGGPVGKNVLFLAQRVLFEDFIDPAEDRALLGSFPDAFDVFHFDHREIVPEGLMDAGDDGGRSSSRISIVEAVMMKGTN